MWTARMILAGLAALSGMSAEAADEYTISDEFDGCEYGKLYELDGGLILECLEYNYFYEYRPRVVAVGTEVIVIGDEVIRGVLHSGTIYKTYISGEFEGCDFDKVYRLDNGLFFQCSTYSYSYAYHPGVKIFAIDGRTPVVFIDGEQYDGSVFRAE